MWSFFIHSVALLFTINERHHVSGVPTCIIIDTNELDLSANDKSQAFNRTSSSILLRNLRMLDHPSSSVLSQFILEPIPLSYIDIKPGSSLADFNRSLMKTTPIEPVEDRIYAPCTLKTLDELEAQMLVPFEFRRLRIEQPDHQAKYLDNQSLEVVPDLSSAVYERRSDPEGVHFCRTCRDGLWTALTICDTVRCDAELLRAHPRLVTEWGEIKAVDGGALYAPSTVFAVYTFGFGPHCKRCEPNGQWSTYALPELCSEIKYFGHPTASLGANEITEKMKTHETTASMRPRKQKQQ